MVQGINNTVVGREIIKEEGKQVKGVPAICASAGIINLAPSLREASNRFPRPLPRKPSERFSVGKTVAKKAHPC